MPSSALSQATNSGEPEGTVLLLVVLRPPRSFCGAAEWLELFEASANSGHHRSSAATNPIGRSSASAMALASTKTRPATPAGYFVADRGGGKPPAEGLLTSSPP